MQPSPGAKQQIAPLQFEPLPPAAHPTSLSTDSPPRGAQPASTPSQGKADSTDSNWSDEPTGSDDPLATTSSPASVKRLIRLHLSSQSMGPTIDDVHPHPTPTASPSHESSAQPVLPSPSSNQHLTTTPALDLIDAVADGGGGGGGGGEPDTGYVSFEHTPRSQSSTHRTYSDGVEMTTSEYLTQRPHQTNTTTISTRMTTTTQVRVESSPPLGQGRPLPKPIAIASGHTTVGGGGGGYARGSPTADLYAPSTPSILSSRLSTAGSMTNGGTAAAAVAARSRAISTAVSFQSAQNPLDDFNEEEFLPPVKAHFGPRMHRLFLDPASKFKVAWSIVLILFIMYSLFEVPMSIGFGYTPTPELRGIAYTIDVFFLLDVALNFVTGYYDEQLELVHDPRMVAMAYLKGWFVWDLLGSIPFDLASAASGGSSSTSGTKAFFVLRAMKIPRLFRMVKLTALLDIRSHRYLREVIRMVKLVLIMVTIGHWIACGFMLTARSESDTVLTWAAPVLDKDIGTQYVFALYWSLTVLSTVGFGDIVPLTQSEMIFTCCTMLLGAILYAVVVGNVMLVLANLNAPSQRHTEEIMKVGDYMRYRKFPPPLMKKVLDFTEAEWKRMRGYNEREVMAHLPESLQTEVARHLHAKMLRSVSFFKDSHSGFINAVVLAFHTTMLLPNTIMLRRNQPGDKLWFISKGSVELIDRGQVYAVLGEGSCVGESALLDGLYRVTARTATYCELCVLYRSDFDRIVKNYPEFVDIINAQAEQTTIMASKMAKLKSLFS